MAKLVGAIQFKGKLKGFNCYERAGVEGIIIRANGGCTKEQYKNDDNFVRSRENGTEFGIASKVAKSIRHSFRYINQLGDSDLHSKFVKINKALIKMDTQGARGQRAVLLSQFGNLLHGYNLNSQYPFNTVMRHPISYTLSREEGNATVVLPDLVPGVNFYNPTPYDFYQVIINLGVVPDLVHNGKIYQSPKGIQYEMCSKSTTECYPVNQRLTGKSYTIQLDNFTGLNEGNTMFLTIGVQFGYPIRNGVSAPKKRQGCGMILATA
jgi:hypothetical protein